MLGLYLLVAIVSAAAVAASPTVFAQWSSLNYSWDATHTYQGYIDSEKFIVINNALAGIKVDSSQNVYVTVPRWREGVPATLNKLVLNTESDGYDLQPYPSWDMQAEDTLGALQNCQSMIIDSKNRMWVIEVGRKYFLSDSPGVTIENAPAGVWVIDMDTDTVISKYYFPDEVAPYNSSFVNDIVLDEVNEIAYLTDAGDEGALIVYDFNNGVSRRYVGESTGRDPSYVFTVNGENYGTDIFTTPVDGIAISGDAFFVYYCSVQGTYLYRLPTAVLRDFSATWGEIDAEVVNLGYKPPSDGMQMWGDLLYYGSLPESTYYALDTEAATMRNLTTAAVPVWPDATEMRWVDTFSLDPSDTERLWFVSNGLDRFIMRTMDFTGKSGPNFRIQW
ncbi:unnamed protein product [Ectocarpus fasciculatus]